MKFGSLFSGIGGFDLALERAGFDCAWQCEIDKACQSILSRHFNARIYNDVRSINRSNAEPVDVICGGFPCQDLSVAGKRAGLAGERSGLWYEFARIIEELKPGWVVIENVPGLLSSNGGRDFGIIIDKLVKCGYGVAWRVLDAQYFGVPQRRRRVFIVGSLGTGRAAEVLFERESSPWDTPPSREKGQGTAWDVAPVLSASGRGTERAGESRGQDCVIPMEPISFDWQAGADGDDSWNGKARSWIVDKPGRTRSLSASHTLAVFTQNQRDEVRDLNDLAGSLSNQPGMKQQNYIAFSAGQSADAYGLAMDENVTPPIRAGESGTNRVPTIAWHENKGGSFTKSDHAKALRSGASHSYQGVGVRRLTPVECERLQGFPDGWTEGQSDSARYRQLGNAVAVPVVEWIARRIY